MSSQNEFYPIWDSKMSCSTTASSSDSMDYDDDDPSSNDCIMEDFQGVQHVEPPAPDTPEFDIRCYKECELIIENTVTGEMSVLCKLYLALDPDVSLILNVLEPPWVGHLLRVEESRWEASLTSRGQLDSHPGSYSTQVSQTRRSKSIVFGYAETSIIAQIEQRVALIANVDVKHLERLVMVRYHPGDYFKEHHDGAFRTHTILIYLNDVDGGETVFPKLNLAIRPMGNTALFWRNTTEDGSADFSMVHAGTSPERGVKYVVNCFFNVEPVRCQ